jgi:isoleucyl-tRNA synthetase
MRKEAGFAVEERITVAVTAPDELCRDLAAHADYLKAETLAVELDLRPAPDFVPELERTWDIDGRSVGIGIRRVS